MKTYILCDHENCTAFDSISEADAREYIESTHNILVPHTGTIEGDYSTDAGELVQVVFIDDVPSDRYKCNEARYTDVAMFIAYDARFDAESDDTHIVPEYESGYDMDEFSADE